MGPVLIDVPMDIQQIEVGEYEEFNFFDPQMIQKVYQMMIFLKLKNFLKTQKDL